MTGKGLFIVFDGGGGLGKSTTLDHLKEELINEGYDIVSTREPGATPIGQEIRRIILSVDHESAPLTDAFLFAADRHQHVETVIRPALQAGKIVLCDRYASATRAYQVAGGADVAVTEQIIALATGGLRSGRTYLFDGPVKVGLQRIAGESRTEVDKFDGRATTFLKAVRAEFLLQAEQHPIEFMVVDANRGRSGVLHTVRDDLYQLIEQAGIVPGFETSGDVHD